MDSYFKFIHYAASNIYSTLASQGQTVYTSVFNEAALEIDSIRNEIIEVLQWL